MTPVSNSQDGSVALFGLGGSGLVDRARADAGGAEVAAWDDGEAAPREGARLSRWSIPVTADWSRFSTR